MYLEKEAEASIDTPKPPALRPAEAANVLAKADVDSKLEDVACICRGKLVRNVYSCIHSNYWYV